MTELGTRLKEARLSKGYSLDDLQEITKIQKRYLSAIEEGNYSIMPGTFYVRAFIKQYAEAVGLDANELLETFKEEIPANMTVENIAATNIQQPQQRSRFVKNATKASSDWMPKIIVALFIIIIIAAIWFLKQHNSSNDVADEPKQQDVKVESTNVQPNSNKDKEAKGNSAVNAKTTKDTANNTTQKISKGTLENDSETTTYTLTGANDFKVKVKVSGSTWVGVQDENGTELTGTAKMYNAGDEVDIDAKGKKSVRVRLGASANATVFVNDEKIKFAATPAQRYTQNIVIKFKGTK